MTADTQASYKQDFLDLALACGVLRFGEFKLKSGRVSPYFFNLGQITQGKTMARLGQFYAQALLDSGLEFDMLFGPAYKGIPLVTSLAIALSGMGRDLPFAYNRKETKDHGEGGKLVGAKPTGRVMIVDDVITAGTAVKESISLLRNAGATPTGLVIALDRQECSPSSDRSAVQEMEAEGLRVISLINLNDLIAMLKARGEDADAVGRIENYRAAYGV